MIGFGQTFEHQVIREQGIKYLGSGKYTVAKMPGTFPISWGKKCMKAAKKDIEEFAKESNAAEYEITDTKIRPPGIGVFPRLDVTFVLLDKYGMIILRDDDKYNKLKKLGKLRDDGILTDEEFEKEKKKILEHE
jgi:hypothetical protein